MGSGRRGWWNQLQSGDIPGGQTKYGNSADLAGAYLGKDDRTKSRTDHVTSFSDGDGNRSSEERAQKIEALRRGLIPSDRSNPNPWWYMSVVRKRLEPVPCLQPTSNPQAPPPGSDSQAPNKAQINEIQRKSKEFAVYNEARSFIRQLQKSGATNIQMTSGVKSYLVRWTIPV